MTPNLPRLSLLWAALAALSWAAGFPVLTLFATALALATASHAVHSSYTARVAAGRVPRWLANLEVIRAYVAHEEPLGDPS